MTSRESKQMKMKFLLPAAALSLALLGGCGGDNNIRVSGATSVSKGQELSDLQRALSEGAITQKEYDTLREKIMKRPN
jgi:hypothetical protein